MKANLILVSLLGLLCGVLCDDDCPISCKCTKGIEGFIAHCTALNASVQRFPEYITDLIITDVESRDKLTLGNSIFENLGLQKVINIKITNSSLNFVDASAFHGLNDLDDVNLSNNEIILFHPDTFKTNSKLQRLTLKGNPLQLTQILKPEQNYLLSSSSLVELDLSHCQLKELTSNTLSQLPNLQYVNLASNNIKTISPQTFQNVEFLEEIDLSHNNIESLEDGLFLDIEDLTTLTLVNNSLQSFDNVDIPDLKELDLSHNHFKIITSESLEGVPDLSLLNLSHNKIESISEDAFAGLLELRYLDLSWNNLKGPLAKFLLEGNKALETLSLAGNSELKVFDGFTGEFGVLYKLDVSECELTELTANSVQGMSFLAILNISGNALTYLDKSLFSKIPRLNDLDASYNKLTSLDAGLFENNSHLKKLNLAGNLIKTLSPRLFRPIPALTTLDVSDNEIHTLWTVNDTKYLRNHNLGSQLKYINLSGNKLKALHKYSFESFINLRSINIFDNPLQCTPSFSALIEWMLIFKINPSIHNDISENMELELESKNLQWDDLLKTVCNLTDNEPTTAKPELKTEKIELNDTYYITVPLPDIPAVPVVNPENMDLITSDQMDDTRTEYSYIWPFLLVILCGISILLALGNLIALLMYRSRYNYRGANYRETLLAPFKHTTLKVNVGSASRYHKLYEECSVPNTPIVKAKFMGNPVFTTKSDLKFTVLGKPAAKGVQMV